MGKPIEGKGGNSMGFFEELLGGGKKESYQPGERRMLIRGGSETGSFQVSESYDVRGDRTVVVGKVSFGTLNLGNKTRLGEKVSEIMSIEISRKRSEQANKGDNAIITLSNVSKKDFKEGDLLSFKTK